MIFQHGDGAPSHNAMFTRSCVPKKMDRMQKSTNLTTKIARSYTDGLLFLVIKEYVYCNSINNQEELEEQIIEVIATITPEMIRNTRACLFRAHFCVELGYFEHIL